MDIELSATKCETECETECETDKPFGDLIFRNVYYFCNHINFAATYDKTNHLMVRPAIIALLLKQGILTHGDAVYISERQKHFRTYTKAKKFISVLKLLNVDKTNIVLRALRATGQDALVDELVGKKKKQ